MLSLFLFVSLASSVHFLERQGVCMCERVCLDFVAPVIFSFVLYFVVAFQTLLLLKL